MLRAQNEDNFASAGSRAKPSVRYVRARKYTRQYTRRVKRNVLPDRRRPGNTRYTRVGLLFTSFMASCALLFLAYLVDLAWSIPSPILCLCWVFLCVNFMYGVVCAWSVALGVKYREDV